MSIFNIFKKKEKWTPEMLGSFLAEAFSKRIMESYNNKSLFFYSLPSCKSDKADVLKEWLVFEMFIMDKGFSSFLKGSPNSTLIRDNFHKYCFYFFLQVHIFHEIDAFYDLIKSRYTSYSISEKEAGGLGVIGDVSKIVLSNLGANDKDIAEIVGVSTYFTNLATSSKNLIIDLMKIIEIEIDSDSSDAYYNLGNRQSKLGLHEEAMESYESAIKINPDNSVAKKRIAELKKI